MTSIEAYQDQICDRLANTHGWAEADFSTPRFGEAVAHCHMKGVSVERAADAMAQAIGHVAPAPAPPPAKPPATRQEYEAAMRTLRGFLGKLQARIVREAANGEEGQWFMDKMVELAATVDATPKTYEQQDAGDAMVFHLHYFKGGCDWYIAEKDKLAEQHQAFGWANLGDDQSAELGYISLVELTGLNVELDFDFKPITLADVKRKSGQ